MAEYIKRETVTNHLDACMDTAWKVDAISRRVCRRYSVLLCL